MSVKVIVSYDGTANEDDFTGEETLDFGGVEADRGAAEQTVHQSESGAGLVPFDAFHRRCPASISTAGGAEV